MDLSFPELAHLTLRAIVTLTVLVGLIDTVYAVILAVAQRVFSAAYVTDFLTSHAAKVWFPIVALAVLGNGVPSFDVPPLEACTLAAEIGLVAYVVATVRSLAVNTVSAKVS